ncbi:MAG: hypothetical protein AAFV47_13430 [Pseudomonadota bacterium]
MRFLIVSLSLLLGSIAGLAGAEISNRDIPPDANWYIYVGMEALRDSDAGAEVLSWIDEDVTSDMERDFGIRITEDTDSVFLYGDGDENFALRLLADFSDETVSKLKAEVLSNDNTTTKKAAWGEYFVIQDLEDELDIDTGEVNIETDTIYVNFDDGKAIYIASTLEHLANEVKGIRGGNNNILVLDGRKPFLQIGVNTDELDADGDFDFDSDLLRQTSKVALTVGSVRDAFDIHTRITATDPEVTESMANIVRGLISLRMLSSEIPDSLSRVIDKLKVESDSSGMSIRLSVTPGELQAFADE